LNTRAEAEANLRDFLVSHERCALVTGTHQNEKHKLVLTTLARVERPSRILFRVNSMENVGSFLDHPAATFHTGLQNPFGPHSMYIDSINPASWNGTPAALNYAILYPVDSVCRKSGRLDIIDDLCRYRNIEKCFLVSWVDNQSYEWLQEYVDRNIAFDAEEENPELHQRVIASINRRQ
jgi:hypothetical protein